MTLKQEIEQALTQRGFVLEGNDLILRDKRVNNIIINGQPIQQEQEVVVKFEYIGDGAVDDHTTVGYAKSVNGDSLFDAWLSDVGDIKLLQ